MKKNLLKMLCCAGVGLVLGGVLLLSIGRSEAANSQREDRPEAYEQQRRIVADYGFAVDVLVNGRPLEEYYARGRSYVEATPGVEYEVRIYNPLPQRVAVALSVDGLNSIDARRTSAWNASKWVIEPYGTIHVSGWQMSSERARRFYFTTERDSYAAKLGQTSNLGVISAVFFREARSVPIPIAPPPGERPLYDESRKSKDIPQTRSEAPKSSGDAQGMARDRSGAIPPVPDDEYAATGIGRSVRNDVRWVNMDLDSRPVGEVTLRYEFYQGLVRLGIMPRPYYRPDPLRRREGATGFEDRRFSPEP